MRDWRSPNPVGAVALAVCLLVGCEAGNGDKLSPQPKSSDSPAEVPVDIQGTVGEVATLFSVADAPISGSGVVMGLGQDGSSEIPPDLRDKLLKYAKTELKIGDPTMNIGPYRPGDLTPAGFLADLDTAVVRVSAIIPRGAPKGTKVDVFVEALPRTNTKSLVGGYLTPIELQWERGEATDRSRYLKPLGRASGPVFVNPFLDPRDTRQQPKLRRGRILHGATVLEDMPLRLQLNRPDYYVCNILQRRINERFPQTGREKVAVAKNRYTVEINIPPNDRDDYEHFLQLILHLPRYGGASAYEVKAKEVAQAMTKTGANHAGLSLVWEAMGRSVLPTVQTLYASEHPEAAFHAARAGLRMGDDRLAGPVVLLYAQKTGAGVQAQAVEELARHPRVLEAESVLRSLLDSPNERIRIAAYEALLRRGETAVIERFDVDGEFYLDCVRTGREYVVYAAQTGQPKITLFGKDMTIAPPVFFTSSDGQVTIFSRTPCSEDEIRGFIDIRAQERKLEYDSFRGRAPKTIDAFRQETQREVEAAREIVAARKRAWKRRIEQGEEIDDRPHDEFEALFLPHLQVRRKLMDGTTDSKPFYLNFKAAPLIRALGSAPRPDEGGVVRGLGLNYSQVVGILAQLCKEKSIQAKFVLQPLPGIQRIYQTEPSADRPDRSEE